MAGYTSFFAGGNNVATKAQPTSGGGNTGANGKGGYSSFFGFNVPKAPSTQQLQQIRQQQAAQAMQNQVQQKAAPQHQSLLSKVANVASKVGNAGVSATKAIGRPLADVATLQGGKATHDTAQLTSDVTGGTVNQFAKGVTQASGVVAGEIASQSKDPYVRAQGVQAVQGAQKKAFGTNDSGTIAKKIVGSTVGTGTMFVGGGEVKGTKTLLQAGKEVTAKRVAKDAAIGATGNAAATVTQNPNASAKQIGESAAMGGALGGTAPHFIKTVGDISRAGASKVASKLSESDSKLIKPAQSIIDTIQGNAAQGQNDLLQAKQNALLSRAQNLGTTGHVAVTPHVAYEPTNPRVKTLIDSAQKQQQAVEAPMKAAQTEQDKVAASAEKAQADGQKIDRQIELLQAKAKDSETGLNNVDQTKLQHLQEDKAQLGGASQPTAPAEPVAKPVSESPNAAAPAKAETAQPAVAKENVTPADNTAKVEASSTNTKINETPQTKEPATTEAPATRTLKPSETAHMPEIGGYTHSSQLAQDYADMLRGQELSARGGQIVKNVDGSYRRISEHSPFYRAVFKETGKAPTKAMYLEQAQKELENGKDGLGAGEDYKKLLEREGKPVPRVQVESTVKDVPQGTSKVAQRIAADIKKNFGEQYKDGAKYDKITIEDQANKAAALISNREELDKVISGEKPLPDGLRATSIVTAIRNTPELAKDGELLRRLASSPISSEASYSAQELRLAAENAKNDPVAAIKSVQKARQDTYKAKTGKSANAAAQSEIKQIRAATPKATVTKESWGSFIDSLKC